MTIGQTIRQLRKEQRLTQDELAQQIGVNRATLWRWEKDKMAVSGRHLKQLSQILSFSFESMSKSMEKPLSSEENRLIGLYRSASEELKQRVLSLLENA